MAGLGGLQPQRQFSDFDSAGVDVHAIQVVGQNGAVAVEFFQTAGIKTAQGVGQFPVIGREYVKGRHQKCAAAARRIDDLDTFQGLLPMRPIQVFASGNVIFHLADFKTGRRTFGRLLAPFALRGQI